MFGLVTPVVKWGERSQQRACRNAMVASTAMTQARIERVEVQEYVAGTLARRSGEGMPEQREAATGA